MRWGRGPGSRRLLQSSRMAIESLSGETGKENSEMGKEGGNERESGGGGGEDGLFHGVMNTGAS